MNLVIGWIQNSVSKNGKNAEDFKTLIVPFFEFIMPFISVSFKFCIKKNEKFFFFKSSEYFFRIEPLMNCQ